MSSEIATWPSLGGVITLVPTGCGVEIDAAKARPSAFRTNPILASAPALACRNEMFATADHMLKLDARAACSVAVQFESGSNS
jgi:hypothetical protein